MLQPGQIEVPFAQGPDTKLDEKLLPEGRLLSLTNATFDGKGTLQKAPGRASLATQALTPSGVATLPAAGQMLATHKGELLQLNRSTEDVSTGRTYSYAAGRMLPRGHAKLLNVAKTRLVHNGQAKYFDADYVESSTGVGFLIFRETVENSGFTEVLYLSAYDVATGTVFLDHYQLSTTTATAAQVAFSPRILHLGGTPTGLLYADDAGNLKFRSLDNAHPEAAPGAEVVVAVNLPVFSLSSIGGYFDAASTFSSLAYVAYYDATAGSAKALQINRATGAVTIAAVTIEAAVPATGISVAIFSTGGSVGIAYRKGAATVRFQTYTANLTGGGIVSLSTAANGYRTAILVTSNTTAEVYFDDESSTANAVFWATVTDTPTITTASAAFARVCGLAALPWMGVDGYRVVPCVAYSTYQPTLFLLRAPGEVHGRLLRGKAAKQTSTTYRAMRLPQSVAKYNNTRDVRFIASELGRFQVSNGAVTSLVQLSRVEVLCLTDTLTPTHNAVELDQLTYFSGAMTAAYDGLSQVEQGFNFFPPAPSLSDGGGGGALSAGDYQVVNVYAWYDAQGRLHRSAPSVPATQTLAANHKLNISVEPLALTDRRALNSRTNVVIETYRTKATELVFYRLPVPYGGTDIINNPEAAGATTIGIVDNTSDATLTANEVLYTQGGELPHLPLPATSYVWTHQRRVMGISAEEDRVVYSNQYDEDIAPSYADGFEIEVESVGGALVAGASLENILVIFREERTYVVQGDGPNEAGNGSTWTEPQALPENVGCVDPRSVIVTPVGVFFKSKKGIYLLSRQLDLSYVGSPVETSNTAAVKASVLVKAAKHVRFILSNTTTLVYNYEFGQWSVWGRGAADAIAWNDTVAWLKSASGAVLQDSGFQDEGVNYSMSLETAWFKLAGLIGYQRIWWVNFLGSYLSGSALELKVGYNYESTYSETVTVADTSTIFTTAVVNIRHQPAIQKCESIRFKLTESGASAPFSALSLSAMRLDYGVKRGSFKPNTGRTI